MLEEEVQVNSQHEFSRVRCRLLKEVICSTQHENLWFVKDFSGSSCLSRKKMKKKEKPNSKSRPKFVRNSIAGSILKSQDKKQRCQRRCVTGDSLTRKGSVLSLVSPTEGRSIRE